MKRLFYSAELVIIALNFFLCYYFLDYFDTLYPLDLIPDRQIIHRPYSETSYLPVFWVCFLIWAIILWLRGGYRELRVQSTWAAMQHVFINGLLFFGFVNSAAFILKFEFLSRPFIFIYSSSVILELMLLRALTLWFLRHARKKGFNVRHVILVGAGRRAQQFMSQVARHPEWGYRIVGLIDKDPALRAESIAGYRVLGTLDELPGILESRVVDEVVFVTPRAWLDEITRCILYCEAVGVPATVSTDLFDLEIASRRPKTLGGNSYLSFETPAIKGGELILKRLFDVVAAGIILILTSPVLAVVTLAIKLSSPGPVFFEQVRTGKNGRKFKLYKFRSMVIDAEKKLAELKEKNEMSGPVFKMTNDPRITPIGRLIRKTSLDEFPQFWNVLKGDMSVVGPRPPLPHEVEQYEPWQRRRLSMKPGITCIWQVSGRNEVGFEEWMKMDLKYIDNWSLLLDIKLLFLTGRAVFASTGK